LRMNSAELLESFFDMQKDYRVQVAAQFVAEVSERFFPEHEVNERAFRLLLAVLRAFKRSAEIERPLLYFNFWLLRLEGFLPDLERCTNCGQALGDEPGYYGLGAEGLLCTRCRGGARQTVSAEARRFAATARHATLDQWLTLQPVPPGCREARLFLEEVIDSHAEKRLVTRSMLNDEL